MPDYVVLISTLGGIAIFGLDGLVMAGDRGAQNDDARFTPTRVGIVAGAHTGGGNGCACRGALALGALAIGARAIARLSILRADLRKVHLGEVKIDDLTVRRSHVIETAPADNEPAKTV